MTVGPSANVFRVVRYLRNIWHDVAVGRCSMLPGCCITWYALVWRHFDWEEAAENGLQGWRARYFVHADSRGYIPCPLCVLSGSKVLVKMCDEACGHRKPCR